MSRTRVFMPCTGLGRVRRGYESFTTECHAAISDAPALDVRLFSSGSVRDARRIPSVARDGSMAELVGRLAGRTGYAAEQATFAAGLLPHVLAGQPDVLFISDITLARIFAKLRGRAGMRYRVLLSNGGLAGPNYADCDHIQQLAPDHLRTAIDRGFPEERQTLLPYGIKPLGPALLSTDERDALRRRLNLPTDRPVLLSVAALDRRQKRLDVLVEELASTGPERPFLMMLGHQEPDAAEILALAERRLGPDGFAARSVPREAVDCYHEAADGLVLSSLVEGLPRALLEAASRGLPCLVHDCAVNRFVLAEHGDYVDCARSGALAAAIPSLLASSRAPVERQQRAASIAERFSWSRLAPRYVEMLTRVAAR